MILIMFLFTMWNNVFKYSSQLQPVVENAKNFHLLSETIKKTTKSGHLWSQTFFSPETGLKQLLDDQIWLSCLSVSRCIPKHFTKSHTIDLTDLISAAQIENDARCYYKSEWWPCHLDLHTCCTLSACVFLVL